MTKKIKAKCGDVFQIPINDDSVSFGQVTDNKSGVLRVITFDILSRASALPNVLEIVKSKIVVLTHTMDAKVYYGDWKVIGNCQVIENLPKPKFKFGIDPVYVTEYGGKTKRIATPAEAIQLDFQFSVAPIRVQNAMQAYFGFKSWEPDFDKLTYEYCIEKSRIAL